MKKHSYFLIIGLVFAGLSFYLGDKVLIPFNDQGLLNITHIIIMGIFVDICIISILIFTHVKIDRLFRKDNFKTSLAIRRAVLITLLLNFLAFLRIFKLWSILNLLLATGIIVLIELLFIPPKTTRSKNNGDKNHRK